MNIGFIIRGYRKKLELTQDALAHGICSVSHLSKIENGSKEVNHKTIDLLLLRLNLNYNKVLEERNQYLIIIQQFYKNIIYQDLETVMNSLKDLQEKQEDISLYGLKNYLELIFFRYYIFREDKKKMQEYKKQLTQKAHKFSQQETLLFTYFNAVYLILERKLKDAVVLLTELKDKEQDFEHFGDFYYHFSLVMSMVKNPGAAIFYGIKALEHFQVHNNFTRKLHIQMNLAICYQRIGANTESQYFYELLLNNATRNGDSKTIAEITHNLSILKKSQDQHEEAIELLQKSIDASKLAGISHLTTLAQLVETYIEKGENEQALTLIPEVLLLSKKEQHTAKEIKYRYKEEFLRLPIQKFAEKHRNFKKLEQHHFYDDIITYCSALVEYYDRKQDLRNKILYLEISNNALKSKLSGG
ncbi:tetratricopeptide repeat protein [Bacillus salitolerans]|uniref:Tetratricopeptide repeat protein n=1 Tax=Bacillus salitolerans TaxID=1437434 RepID=A0ABW4LMC5_9BACI